MDKLEQISIFSENRPGRLKKITKVLADEGINILAVNIASSNGFGVLKFIVDKTEAAYQKLKKRGFTASRNEVLAIELVDKPGGLYDAAAVLAKKRVNIENAYVLIPKYRKTAYLIVEVDDIEKAKKRLEHEKLRFYRKDSRKKK